MTRFQILIVLNILFAGCKNQIPAITTGYEGKPIPSFNLLLTDSQTYVNPSLENNENPIVLIYFSPNCPFCRAQIDGIVQNITSLNKINFYLLTPWPLNEVRDFCTYYHLAKYSNITVGRDYSNFFNKNFQIRGIPFTAIYGKDKTLNQAFLGKMGYMQIKEVAEN